MADPVRLDTAGFIVPMTALICLNIVVIIGNVMVIMAVFTHSKLRSMTTNKFIVSLAVADLMVGLVVLPFSSANEVSLSTIFLQFFFVAYFRFSFSRNVYKF